MTRIGIVGTENSHVDHFIRHLNVEKEFGEWRAVALGGGDNERNRALAETGKIDVIAESAEDFLDQIDALIISNRDGGLHAAPAIAALEAGKSVLVDKPLATSVADAEAVIAAAKKSSGVLASYSALRHLADVAAIKAELAELGTPQVVIASGPADPDSEYAGLFFYGVHSIEVIMEILGNPSIDGAVHVDRVGSTVTATAQAGGVEIITNFVRPGEAGPLEFHAMVIGSKGIRARYLLRDRDYNRASTRVFLDAIASGNPPIEYDQLLPPVEFLSKATAAL